MYEYQFQMILRNETSADEVAAQWSASRQRSFVSRYRLCILTSDQPDCNQLEAMSRRKFADNPDVFITRLDNVLVVLAMYQRDGESEQKIFDDLEQAALPYTLHGIIGEEFADISELHEQYQHISEAMPVKQIMFPEQKLVEYKDLIPYHLIYNADLSGDIHSFLSPQIIALNEYDKEHDTDYYNTLKVFLLSGSRQKTAKHLGIHKNTVAYRLQKICEIIGVDVENEDTKYKLLQSCYVYEYLSKKEQLAEADS